MPRSLAGVEPLLQQQARSPRTSSRRLRRAAAAPALARRKAAATCRSMWRSAALGPGRQVQSCLMISHHLRRRHQCLDPQPAVRASSTWHRRRSVDVAGRAPFRYRHRLHDKPGRTGLLSQARLPPPSSLLPQSSVGHGSDRSQLATGRDCPER
jgi:hypothetical protein